MQQSEERQRVLEAFKRLLNTPDGEKLVDELADAWDGPRLISDTAEDTAYNVGLRDAFKFIQSLQRGDFINE